MAVAPADCLRRCRPADRLGICLRLTLRSIGGIRLLLANAFLAALFWLFADWGWLLIENVAAISWIGLVSVAAILAVGMSWSRLRASRAARPT